MPVMPSYRHQCQLIMRATLACNGLNSLHITIEIWIRSSSQKLSQFGRVERMIYLSKLLSTNLSGNPPSCKKFPDLNNLLFPKE